MRSRHFAYGENIYAVAKDLKWLVRTGATPDMVMQRPELTSRLDKPEHGTLAIVRAVEAIKEPVWLPDHYRAHELPPTAVRKALAELLAFDAVRRRWSPDSVGARRWRAAMIFFDSTRIFIGAEKWRKLKKKPGVEIQLMMVLAERFLELNDSLTLF